MNMKTCGIITEYNPFHQGHIYHIKKTKELTQCDCLIAIVSNHFTQRGLFSLLTMEDKTKLALEAGCNLVMELPPCYAAQSADYFATTEDQDELILENTTTLKVARWWNRACDIIPCNGGKDIGIQKILDYFNFNKEEAMAFGDGGNDISMLKYVGTGVAMGNAKDDVKAIADYITDSVQEDGIVSALKHFEIL